MDAALCAQTDPEIFFPEKGSYSRPKRVCAACPVQEECGEHAQRFEGTVSHSLRHGLWGGQAGVSRAKAAEGRAA
ncbi:WhiB family transcriptional regulator [Streptomyces sp. NPDC046821]|uniref:WhiB family transcriptional regulator n=1 Tax=Streptomyces sp. NPDC046821 TaxID=3154702 RepID=UPI0033CB044A